MEGPTPVSALIHAATMVTAGIFAFLRLAQFFSMYHYFSNFVVIIGILTALFSALTAVSQMDIKKIIAFSTCSQLGYMIVALGLTQYTSGFFHLINHAFFKALLFLTAGSVIHALSDDQDIRYNGSLISFTPITYVLI
jgi:NADH:ubiquinone oxidoreductase subunit 5 (subunit L)/multisubunit Na+/H+ antiporter MnhA subunit